MATEEELRQKANEIRTLLGREPVAIPERPPTGAEAAQAFLERRAAEPAGVIPTLLSPRGIARDVAELPGQVTSGIRGLLEASGREALAVRREHPILSQVPGVTPLAGMGRAFFGQPMRDVLEQTGSLSSAASGALAGAALGGPVGAVVGGALGPQAFDLILEFLKRKPGKSSIEKAEDMRRDVVTGLLTLGAVKGVQGTARGVSRIREVVHPSARALAIKEAEAPGAAAARLGVPRGSSGVQRQLASELDDALPVLEKRSILKGLRIDKSDPAGPQKFFNAAKKNNAKALSDIADERNALLSKADKIAQKSADPFKQGIGADDIDFSSFDKALGKLQIGGTETTGSNIQAFNDVRREFLRNFEAAGKPLSLQELTKLQQNLFRELKQLKAFSPQASGGAFVDPAQAARIQARIEPIKELTKSVRNTINKRAKELLGKVEGSKVQELNTDYSKLKPFVDGLETLEFRNQLLRSAEAAGTPERTTFPTNRTGLLSRLGGGARTQAELLDAPAKAIQGIQGILDVRAGRVALPSRSLANIPVNPMIPGTATVVSGQTRPNSDRERIMKALALGGK